MENQNLLNEFIGILGISDQIPSGLSKLMPDTIIKNLHPEAEKDSNLPVYKGYEQINFLAPDTDVKNTLNKVTTSDNLEKGEERKEAQGDSKAK